MRILHCIPSTEGGGAERQLTLLALEQKRRGHDVHVAVARHGIYSQQLQHAGIRARTVPLPGRSPIAAVAAVVGLMRRNRIQAVQTWLPLMDIVGGLAAVITGTPWIVCERSSAMAYPNAVLTRFRLRLGRLAAACVANSRPGSEYWRPHIGPHAHLYVIPNAVPVEAIDAAQPAPALPHPLILFVGRLSREKNPILFLRAMTLVLRETAAHAALCGTGPELDEVRRAIVEAGLEKRVTVLGFRSDVWSLMKGADLLVSTSTFEGNPNAVDEAMAARCPIVLSDIPAHRAYADDNMALFVPLDADAMASAIVESLRDPHAARERARRARVAAESRTVRDVADAYDRIYADVGGVASRARRIATVATVMLRPNRATGQRGD